MIKYWHITGDLHGRMQRLYDLKFDNPAVHAIIVLGDFSINYFGDESENIKKQMVNNKGFKIYAVRGNHERRPEDVPGMIKQFDVNVGGDVSIAGDVILGGTNNQAGALNVAVIGNPLVVKTTSTGGDIDIDGSVNALASARAIETLCCSPPESADGKLFR